jgi:hypothetical protein
MSGGHAAGHRSYKRPRQATLQIKLCFDLLPGDRLARLVHGHVSFGGVYGVLGSAESLDHRFRNDGGHALTVNSEMGDDATASQLDRLLDGWAADGEIACGLAHTDKCRDCHYTP